MGTTKKIPWRKLRTIYVSDSPITHSKTVNSEPFLRARMPELDSIRGISVLPVGGFDARRVDQPPCFVGIPGPQLDLHGQCYRTLWHTDTIWGALVARRRRALLLVLADSGTSSFTTRHRNRRNNNLHYVHFA